MATCSRSINITQLLHCLVVRELAYAENVNATTDSMEIHASAETLDVQIIVEVSSVRIGIFIHCKM